MGVLPRQSGLYGCCPEVSWACADPGNGPNASCRDIYYDLEEGKTRHSISLLERALAGFDQFWEKEPSADALLALIPLLRRPDQQERRREAIVELYGVNPGALPQAGIGLPLAVSWAGTGWSARQKGVVLRFLRRAGSDCREVPSSGYRYALRLDRADAVIRWTITDSTSVAVVHEGKTAASARQSGNLRNWSGRSLKSSIPFTKL